METAGVNKELVDRIRKIYMETRNKIKVGEKLSGGFWTEEGYLLYPTLFAIFIADIEVELKEGVVVVRIEKFWIL